jgi:hypothetical protein
MVVEKVCEYSTPKPKIEGLNHDTWPGREKMADKVSLR